MKNSDFPVAATTLRTWCKVADKSTLIFALMVGYQQQQLRRFYPEAHKDIKAVATFLESDHIELSAMYLRNPRVMHQLLRHTHHQLHHVSG